MSYHHTTTETSGHSNTTLAGNDFSKAHHSNNPVTNIRQSFASRKKTTKDTILLLLAVLFVILVLVGTVLGIIFALRKEQNSNTAPSYQSHSGVESSSDALLFESNTGPSLHSGTNPTLYETTATSSASSPPTSPSPASPNNSPSSASPISTSINPAAVATGEACTDDKQCESPNVCYNGNNGPTGSCCGPKIAGCIQCDTSEAFINSCHDAVNQYIDGVDYSSHQRFTVGDCYADWACSGTYPFKDGKDIKNVFNVGIYQKAGCQSCGEWWPNDGSNCHATVQSRGC